MTVQNLICKQGDIESLDSAIGDPYSAASGEHFRLLSCAIEWFIVLPITPAISIMLLRVLFLQQQPGAFWSKKAGEPSQVFWG
jgi:hypothetical protein